MVMLMIMAAILAIVSMISGINVLASCRRYGVGPLALRKYSNASKKIMALNNRLPKDEGFPEVAKTLRNIDSKQDRSEVNKHFSEYSYHLDSREFTWSCDCWDGCKYDAYKELYYALDSIQSAVALREEKFREMNIAPDYADIRRLTEDANARSEIITQVTKELTQ